MWLGDTNQRKVDNIKKVGGYNYPGIAILIPTAQGLSTLKALEIAAIVILC
jgi:hypothetical protein